jgi:hypothetical protein
MSTQRLVVVTVLAFPLALGCSNDTAGDQPMFTSGDASQGDDGSGTADETGGNDMNGDGDQTGDGDGDSTGDGDGDQTTGDGDGEPGCETDPAEVAGSCGENPGVKGAIAVGESMTSLPMGGISVLDNGPGNGAEDWYRFDFPVDNANPRPNAGMPTVSFAVNEGGDYHFEVYRDCGAQVFGQGLAAEFGTNAPPLQEWSFHDLDAGGVEQANYTENVLWPGSVWVRVIRSQNAGSCSNYQLLVTR